MKDAQPPTRQDLSTSRVNAKSKVDFLHPIRNRQRHVPARVDKRAASIHACSAQKIGRPLCALFIQTDRFPDVIKSRAHNRRLRESFEEFQHTCEVVRVNRIRVVVEARDKFKLRRMNQLVPSTTWADLIRAEQNAEV